MTLIQVHLLMLLLGVIAGISVTGSRLFKRPAATWHRAGPTRQQRILGVLAFLIVAASPLIRVWRNTLTDLALLQQTFLVAAIGLLALLLYALLQRPHKQKQELVSHAKTNPTQDSVEAIQIDADIAADVGASGPAVAHTVDQMHATHTPHNLNNETNQIPSNVDVIDSPHKLSEAANDRARTPLTTPAKIDSSNLSFFANLDQLIADNHAELKATEIAMPATLLATNAVDDNLDLSDTEELYAEIRLHAENVELPNSDGWLADFDDLVVFDDSLVLADEHIATPTSESTLSIVDGELLSDETIPTTLSEALALGKSHTLELQQQFDKLNKKLAELQDIHQQIRAEQQQSQPDSTQIMVNQKHLLNSEACARDAAESVITAQRSMLDHSEQQETHYDQLLRAEHARQANYRNEAARSKTMARQAAALARKATIAHQAIRDVAKREQEARLRSQESAKKAVNIARNAISALAAEERKNTLTHH